VNQEVFAALAAALEKGEPVALVTITGSTGSTPQRVGAKMLVYEDGRTVGTIGGGCYENEAFWKAREAIKSRKPLNMSFELNDDFAQETGLVCGGQMEVFIEPVEVVARAVRLRRRPRGPLRRQMAHEVGFRVHVIDDREKFASTERFGPGIDVIVDDIPTWLDKHTLPAIAYAVVVTRGIARPRNDARAAEDAAPLSRPHRQQGQGEAHLRHAARRRRVARHAAARCTPPSGSTSAPSRRRRSPSASSPS
jgi:xanthine dehydrogenase accessory factor